MQGRRQPFEELWTVGRAFHSGRKPSDAGKNGLYSRLKFGQWSWDIVDKGKGSHNWGRGSRQKPDHMNPCRLYYRVQIFSISSMGWWKHFKLANLTYVLKIQAVWCRVNNWEVRRNVSIISGVLKGIGATLWDVSEIWGTFLVDKTVLGSVGIEWAGPGDLTCHTMNEIFLPREELSWISPNF